MLGMSCRPVSLMTSLVSVLALVAMVTDGQIFGTMCTTRRFRRLSLKLQNEHQCLQMEQIQSETLLQQKDQGKHHRDLMNYLMAMDAKVDSLLYDLSENEEVWEAKWARKLKEARAHMKKTHVVIATQSDDDSGESDDCENAICTANPFMANIDMRPIPHDCYEWQLAGEKVSGVYPVRMSSERVILTYCDMDIDGGGWTLLQRRRDGSVPFNRNWATYKEGFGNPNGEFWLGNEYIHELTSVKNYTLQVRVWDWEDQEAYAMYAKFRVMSEGHNYRLKVGDYHGNAGDSFSYHNNMNFSTPDRDNDDWFGACSRRDRAGWWFKDCGFATLNSQYHDLYNSLGTSSLRDGILWYHWHEDQSQSLKRVEMMIRPTNIDI